MERFALDQLQRWKEKPNRKPLMMRGARQVGKTWLLKEFGKRSFKNAVYVNFEDAPSLKNLFVADFDIPRILNVLEIFSGEKIIAGETLIILDEIQAAERAVTSLKYFQEKTPEYYIIAAGSLLGISMPDKSSFPVGKVDFLNVYPMTFSEFLTALGEDKLLESLKSRDWPTLGVFKSRFIEYLKTYYYVGGMPEAVAEYVNNKDWDEVRNVQKSIIMAYESDFSKHAPGTTIPRIRMVWQNIPAQLAKENKKFMYGSLKTGGRAKDFELAIQWLTDAGLLLKNCRVSKPEIPLTAFEELTVFKLFLSDVGLLTAMCNLPAQTMIKGNELFLQFKGALTEQFVMQQLLAMEMDKITYWTNERSTNEVDFVIQNNGQVIAIEVKAETNTRAKSFRFFYEKFKPTQAYRLSLKDHKEEKWFTNIPLFAVEYVI